MPKANPAPKKPAKKPAKEPAPKPAPARMSLKDAMAALEKAGSAQTRKTYARHGACEPVFGVQFGTLKKMVDRIKIDQELAEALWETGNFDARNLAAKIVDPVNISSKVLDRWAATPIAWTWGGYVGQIAAEGPPPRGREKAEKWLKSKDEPTRSAGWCAVAALAMIDESLPDSWFAARLTEIEKTIKTAPNRITSLMNRAMIAIGGRNARLRTSATALAKRLGEIEVDHGDTSCKTPAAALSIDKAWDRAKAGGFESPAAQERARESMRTRC